MICHIEGCEREAMYKAKRLCQMHYFRIMRNGKHDPKRQRKYRMADSRGYQSLFEPTHPLAHKNGYVREHRFVLYKKLNEIIKPCELCGKELTWETCCVDHIDNDPTNNSPDNLRPTCMLCNIQRTPVAGIEHRNATALTFDGKTLTPTEWARDSRVNVCALTIRRRKKMGMSDFDALFSEKITHNGKIWTPPPPPPKHTRKNAIRITIDGVTMTAAEWSRHPGCKVPQETIVYRFKSGCSHYDCVFKPSRNKNPGIAPGVLS